jgi:hypothetical protein
MEHKQETIDIKLDERSKINLSLNKVKELVEYLEMDEIVDSMTDKRQIDALIERLCMDYPDKITKLLNDFFNHKSDANKYLDATQQEDLENDYEDYLTNRYKL